jgi:hypothetical protein
MQGGEALRVIDALGCLRSLRARSRLIGKLGQGGKVENAAAGGASGYKIHAVICPLPRASLLAGARCGLLSQSSKIQDLQFQLPDRQIGAAQAIAEFARKRGDKLDCDVRIPVTQRSECRRA